MKHWINGEDVPAETTLDVVNPANGTVVAHMPLGTPEDVDRAVAAATKALPAWAATSPQERAKRLKALAHELRERNEELAQAISTEIGAPISLARAAQAGLPPLVADSTADLAAGFAWTETVGTSLVVREPVGVVGVITPWNFPLQQIMTKLAPALLAGNTVVAKPAELAPTSMPILAAAVKAAEIPDGVVNIVYGTGPVVGEAIAKHPGIDMVSFTGSTAVGKRISVLAAETVKRVALELGGKSASVVLDDADLQLAVERTLTTAWTNSGQVCGAWSRMIVPATRRDEILDRLTKAAEDYRLGDPSEETTRLGPLASETQWTRVDNHVERGLEQGATLVLGGPGRVPGLEHGAYFRPTILADVHPDSALAQEEIFGPVLSVLTYTDEDEAIAIANNSVYGLTGAVFGEPARALAIARRLRTGQVDVNEGQFNVLAPFGGYKQSGNGREFGYLGVEEFTEVKSIQR
ncbi:aldehyde dehydrogenase family protein [Amycolatopsis sp. DSM 110486]|uniref:aldehyde dehydrogenase family protein n=1 Tax=Amycolatopsis sp. DSM 110486 TaxID=2865832 RepID=UPI001C6A737E|nr:aldehyde dehydrogenase family protein [Amycolatopsis sp. DSM 110486]QYN22970.1 aldehyde dehydrogenase family protein [Amycolatopsis sp. DSM 110486]